MKIKGLIIILLLIFPVFLTAQTAQAIEELLNTQALSNLQAAWLVLEAADVPYQNNHFRHAVQQEWLPENSGPNDRIRLDEASLLLMKAFDIKGGILYNLVGGPRYAYRELTYLNIIQGRAVPSMAVSGELMLFMVGRILSQYVDESQEPERSAGFLQESELVPSLQELVLMEEIRAELEAYEMSDVSVVLTEQGIMISLSDIQFLADSSELPNAEREKLRDIAYLLRQAQARRLMIIGHTALAGTYEGRMQVSLDRAQAVKDYLVSLDVLPANSISVQGMGAERPVGDNNTPEGMALNRRVEIIILERD